MEDNLYHPYLELFKHQLFFIGNMAVQYFLNFIFLLFYYFLNILLHKYFSETLSPYVCLIVYYWLSTIHIFRHIILEVMIARTAWDFKFSSIGYI